MNKEQQRKIVGGLRLLVLSINQEIEEAIHKSYLNPTERKLASFKRCLDIINGLPYFPEKDRTYLGSLYNVAEQNARSFFGSLMDGGQGEH